MWTESFFVHAPPHLRSRTGLELEPAPPVASFPTPVLCEPAPCDILFEDVPLSLQAQQHPATFINDGDYDDGDDGDGDGDGGDGGACCDSSRQEHGVGLDCEPEYGA